MLEYYYIGSIASFGFGYVPQGWAACDGQLINISDNETLFTLIGTTYGGDGVNTFAVPDLRGRTILNQGTGRGLKNILLGEQSGSTSVAMNMATMPTHRHALNTVRAQTKLNVTTNGGPTNEPGSGEFGLGAAGSFPSIFSDSATIGSTDFIGGVQVGVPTISTSSAGNNLPIDVTNPFLGVNFCINLYGIFPSKS
jgi:microcystin-dependent protein